MYIPVRILKDDDGHDYLIPFDKVTEFEDDLNDEYFVDIGNFDLKWG